jgi:uncharacterized protein (DUF2267 family)
MSATGELRNLRPVDPKDAATAVFRVLNHYLDPEQVGKVRDALPEEVRRLWPANNASAARSVDSAA